MLIGALKTLNIFKDRGTTGLKFLNFGQKPTTPRDMTHEGFMIIN